ncbi:MAG: hypothetical protein NC177_00125 [Ruminococcus flavefaciens]|nr:hypothetical protein [Ruminococcus flavefaciens]
MAEVVKCPNCNAQIHAVPNTNVLKCDYCDTEIIIDNNIQNLSAQTNGITENYEEKKKKWDKSFFIHLIIQAVLSALFAIFIETSSVVALIMFLASAVYSFVLPFYLLKDKPLLSQSQNNRKFLEFIKIYPAFAGVFWGGIILVTVLVNI